MRSIWGVIPGNATKKFFPKNLLNSKKIFPILPKKNYTLTYNI